MQKLRVLDPYSLNVLLRYDAESGQLFWRPRGPAQISDPAKCATWNTRYASKLAFTAKSDAGYLVGRLAGMTLRAHRVIWAMSQNAWPTGEIDHIDGNKTNNKLANLREVTRSENERNKGLTRLNKSGGKCVYWNFKDQKWEVRVGLHGFKHYIGQFSDLADAIAAAKEARATLHGQFARHS